MKFVVSGLAQLLAVIVLTITLAVSLAALSLWADSGAQQPTPHVAAGLP
jgi:hypothetical protein